MRNWIIVTLLLGSPYLAHANTEFVYPTPKEYAAEKITSEPLIEGKVLQKNICRAAIITLMSYELKETISKQINANISAVARYRKADDTIWNYICKINKNDVVWASMNIDGPQKLSVGRWRIHPDDEKITFTIEQESLIVTVSYSPKEQVKKSFLLKSINKW